MSRKLAYTTKRLFGNGSVHKRNVEKTATNPPHILYYYGFVPTAFNLTLCARVSTLTCNLVFILYPKWLIRAYYKRSEIVIIPGLLAMKSASWCIQSIGWWSLSVVVSFTASYIPNFSLLTLPMLIYSLALSPICCLTLVQLPAWNCQLTLPQLSPNCPFKHQNPLCH